MGANILANLIGHTGEQCVLDAAVICQAPIRKWECSEQLRTAMYGAYNTGMGKNLNAVMLRHEAMLKDVLKEKLGPDFDIRERVNNTAPNILAFDDEITAPLFGWKDRDDYYRTSACYHRIPSISIPTLFMNAKDDPIVGLKAIEFELFKSNPNAAIATTDHGGHLGYHTSIWSSEQWFMKPVLDFLDAFKDPPKARM